MKTILFYRSPEDTLKQSHILSEELEKEYGISGSCYQYCWQGKDTSPLPETSHTDLPFCFYWLNNYPDQKRNSKAYDHYYDDAHYAYLLQVFSDPRYIRVEGKPLFIIEDVSNTPPLLRFASSIRFRAKKKGFSGVYLVAADPVADDWDPRSCLLDAKLPGRPGTVLDMEQQKTGFLSELLSALLLKDGGLYEPGKNIDLARLLR